MTKKRKIDGIVEAIFSDDLEFSLDSEPSDDIAEADDVFTTEDDEAISAVVAMEEQDALDAMGLEVDTVYVDAIGASSGGDDISDLITDIDDEIEHLTWVIYGKNGTGKTTFLSTVEGMLVLAAEDGTLSIRDKAKGKAKKLRIKTWKDLENVYWLLKRGKYTGEGIEIPVKGGTFLVKSIGFDTLTRLADICLRNVVLGEKEKDASIDVLSPTLKHQGQAAQRMKYWLEQFKEFPVQKVWLVQEASNTEDVDSDEFSIYPALSPSIRTYVLSQADIIGRMYIKQLGDGKVQFRLSTAPNAKYVTKDRTTLLSGIIPNPRLDTLYKKVFG